MAYSSESFTTTRSSPDAWKLTQAVLVGSTPVLLSLCVDFSQYLCFGFPAGCGHANDESQLRSRAAATARSPVLPGGAGHGGWSSDGQELRCPSTASYLTDYRVRSPGAAIRHI
jgi:hypothetical protein